MLRSKKRVLDVGELDSALEEGLSKKSPRAMTTPGTLRLMKDLEELESNATVILEQNDGPNIVSMEYHVDQGFRGRCPNRFEVTVPKMYPHDPPVVRCIDDGFSCRFIDQKGVVMHQGLRNNWTAICTLGHVVQILQSIRSLFLSLHDDTMDATDASYLFGKVPEAPIAQRSRSVGEQGNDNDDDDDNDNDDDDDGEFKGERPSSKLKLSNNRSNDEDMFGCMESENNYEIFPSNGNTVEQYRQSPEASIRTYSHDSVTKMAVEDT